MCTGIPRDRIGLHLCKFYKLPAFSVKTCQHTWAWNWADDVQLHNSPQGSNWPTLSPTEFAALHLCRELSCSSRCVATARVDPRENELHGPAREQIYPLITFLGQGIHTPSYPFHTPEICTPTKISPWVANFATARTRERAHSREIKFALWLSENGVSDPNCQHQPGASLINSLWCQESFSPPEWEKVNHCLLWEHPRHIIVADPHFGAKALSILLLVALLLSCGDLICGFYWPPSW